MVTHTVTATLKISTENSPGPSGEGKNKTIVKNSTCYNLN